MKPVAALFLLAMTSPSWSSDFAGRWEGSYECDGIERRMAIELRDSFDNSLSGTFSFEVDGTPARFVVSGVVDEAGDRVAMVPGEWIVHPEGYSPVGFVGRLDGDILFGSMSAPSCGSFYARKVESR